MSKKTERMLLRVSEEMSKQIRQLAEEEHRTICDQIRHLIATALSQKSLKDSKDTIG